MAIFKLVTAVRNAMGQVIVDALDAGAGAAILEFYTGTMPATTGGALSGNTLLGTLTCSDPSATISTGILTFSVIAQDNAADASGTASWARLKDSTGAAVADMDVTDLAGTGTIKLNTVTIVAGGPILMNSYVITVGA